MGAVWQSRQPKFLQHVVKANLHTFKRLQYGIYYGIGSVHLSCVVDGVLELGTTNIWRSPPVFVQHSTESVWRRAVISERTSADPRAHLAAFEPTRERLQLVCEVTEGSEYAIFWQFFPQV